LPSTRMGEEAWVSAMAGGGAYLAGGFCRGCPGMTGPAMKSVNIRAPTAFLSGNSFLLDILE